MAADDLLAQLRAAFAGDLAEGVRVLEEGLVALEREPEGEGRAALLRDVFRAAHGLKGSARAAGLPAIEGACHLMESLLGAARDHGRALGPDDFGALLAAVDALGAAQHRLAESPLAALDEAPFAAARERLEAALEGSPPPAPATTTRESGHPQRSSDAPASERSRRAPTAPATAGESGHPERSSDAPASERSRRAPTAPATAGESGHPERSSDAPASERSRRAATATASASATAPAPEESAHPERAQSAPSVPAMSAPGRRGAVRAPAVRLPPERLDALAVAGAALVTAAHQAEASAARLDDLAREARRLRIRARTEIRAPGAGGLEDDLRRHERALAGVRAQATQEARALERRTRRLSADIRALRLTPWSEATAGLERMVRDVAARRGTEVELALENQALEIDRAVVDVLREPLSQLVSNAIAHAIEPPDERRAAGKPSRGRVEVAARVDGERLLVTVTDDGRGLDPERLRAEARRRGMAVPAEARRTLELVFVPGFSTVPAVTEEAGRGVGLDLVATAVRAKRGTVAVASTPGRGTTFELAIPATLYGLRAVLARDGGQLYALPALDVERVVRVVPEGVGRMEGRPVLLGREPLPLAPLGHAAGVDTAPWKVEDRRTALVVSAGGRRAAFAVDEVLAERELALEPLPHRAEGAFVSAVSVLPGGGLALVLAAEALLEAAGGAALPAEVRPAEARRRRILLADDAATTRALARSILEAAGYEVLSAADGEQAFALLQQQGADALVSDVEMPGLDGFELARSIRATPRFARLPVVLLTALSSDADRRRGLEAGASAYLVKSAFDQRQLLDTLGELLGELP